MMEELNCDLEKLIDDFAAEKQVSDYHMTDILLRLVCKYHFREICQKHLRQESEVEAWQR
jgi:hypothetical protein